MHVTKTKPRKWEEEDLARLKELKGRGISNKEIALDLDRTEVSVQIKLKRLKKGKATYNEKHRKDKYRANDEFLSILKPKSVLDVFAGEESYYKDKVENLVTNDKNVDFFNCDYNLNALSLLCNLYYQKRKFDLIDLDPFGSAYECFDLSIKMAKKGLIITFGEMGHKRWKRLDYVSRFYDINNLEEFRVNKMIDQVSVIAEQNHKKLEIVAIKEWRNIARCYFKLEKLKFNVWEKDETQTQLNKWW